MKKTTSNPGKGSGPAVPQQHWERKYDAFQVGGNTPAGAFDAKLAKNRPCTHIKVNEDDH